MENNPKEISNSTSTLKEMEQVFKKFCEILRCKKMLVNVCKFSNLTVINV